MYAIPFFIVLMALEYVYGRARGRNTYRLADTVNSLSLGTLSRLSGLVKLGIGGVVFELVRAELGLTTLSADAWLVWVAAFIGYDVCYYWSHRFGHEWKLFWASHVAHHQSEEFNLSTALRQTSTGTTFIFYVPLYLLGFPAEVVITVGALNLIYQFWVHTEHVPHLGPLEWLFVTPSNHRVHHARNPCYVDKNYGGVFIVWDRLFGTFTPERPEEPCVYGITHRLASWNPLWANAHVWLETARDTLATRRWRDKIKLWFTSPGWRPADLPAHEDDWRAPKYQPAMIPGSSGVVFIQYWLVTIASLALLLVADKVPYAFTLTAVLLLASSFYVLGTFLEGRRHALMVELGRLVLLAGAIGYWQSTLGPTLTALLIGYCAASLAAAWLTAGRRLPSLAGDTVPAEGAGDVAGTR